MKDGTYKSDDKNNSFVQFSNDGLYLILNLIFKLILNHKLLQLNLRGGFLYQS